MQKQAPTPGKIATMVLFAMSCFGLLLFLWVSFGGASPLKSEGYRVLVAFPEATQLAKEADVRVAGVTVGTVVSKKRDPRGNHTLATLELKPEYAPLNADARASLRTKTLLGETYVELTTGSSGAGAVPDGGRLDEKQVQPTVELDEILNSLDDYTRKSFRTWQQSLAQGVKGRGADLNASLSTLPQFVDDGASLLEVLDEQQAALGGVVRNTGVVFDALTRHEGQLRALVENSDTVFSAIARERESFAQTFNVFPTFLDESKATFTRLQSFSAKATPLARDLKPAFEDLAPTLDEVRRFGPDLQRLFRAMDPLITISKKSLPATRQIFEKLRPMLGELGPYLSELNPVLTWLNYHQATISDLFANLGWSTSARTGSTVPGAPGHYLRQFGPVGTETVGVYPNRLGSNRGNAYLNPLGTIQTRKGASLGGILPSWDCNNTGGEHPEGGVPPAPACHVQAPYNGQRFPTIKAKPYG